MKPLVALVVVALAGSAHASDSPLEQAEAAVRGMRAQTYLPTACEQAFHRFWQAYRAPGDRRLIEDPSPTRREQYFGFGNPDSADALDRAQQVCAQQTGVDGNLVVRVLERRAKAKEKRLRRLEESHSLIQGY